MLQKILFQINAVLSNFLLKKILNKKMYHSFHKSKLVIFNDSRASNQHIRMISEGSCDTEDWSNDVENSALRHRNKVCIKI